MSNIPPSRSPSPAAQPMRLYRERRRQRLRYISIPLHVTEIDALIRMRLLKEEERQDVPGRPALHYVLFALPTFTSRQKSARSRSRRKCDRFFVAITFRHHGPRHPRDLVGKRDRGNLRGPPRQQCREPGPMLRAMDLGIADDGQRTRRE